MDKDKYEQIIKVVQCRHNNDLKIIKYLFIILILVIIICTGVLSILINSAENKTDLRYFNTKEAIALTHNKWVNEYTGEIFYTKKAYEASLRQQYIGKRKTLVKKALIYMAR